MKPLTGSYEWCLLEELKSGTVDRLARRRRSSQSTMPARRSLDHSTFVVDNNMAFLEPALRTVVLKWQLSTPLLPDAIHDELQTKLRSLLELLEKVVNPELASREMASYSTQEMNIDDPAERKCGDGHSPPARTYPNLTSLLLYLKSKDADASALNMVHGSNKRLFVVPRGTIAKAILDAADDYNDYFLRRCQNTHNSSWAAPSTTQSAEPTSSPIRERTNMVLGALFHRLSECQGQHEVLFHISGETGATVCQRSLDMFISSCAYPHKWQQAECLSYEYHSQYVSLSLTLSALPVA